MNDLFSAINPQYAVILAIAWLIREILGIFQKTILSIKKEDTSKEAFILESILKQMQENTKLLQTMCNEMSRVNDRILNLENKLQS